MTEGGYSVEGLWLNAYVYSLFFDVITQRSHMLAKWVPDFLIKESLRYFEKQEQYEKCQAIKSFFDKNPARVRPMSRDEWMDKGWRSVHGH